MIYFIYLLSGFKAVDLLLFPDLLVTEYGYIELNIMWCYTGG